MYFYTCHKGKHLKLPIPNDWNPEDIKYFITGIEQGEGAKDIPPFNPKEHIEAKDDDVQREFEEDIQKTLRQTNKRIEEMQKRIDDKLKEKSVETGGPEPIEGTVSTTEKPTEKPIGAQANGKSTVGPCPSHPNYRGLRLGKTVKECPNCLKIYQHNRDIGVVETRR